MTQAMPSSGSIEKRLAEVLALHFDPATGTPYWLEVAARLGFDPRREIREIGELQRIGFMDADAMRRRPLSDLVSREAMSRPAEVHVVQTGGTLGDPIWTAYSQAEYEAAFVYPFVAAAHHVGFPRGGVWLYVGPSGPHVIGRAARSIARATGSIEPFFVDFDPRWVRKLPDASFAAERYLAHVLDQAMGVLDSQPITCLFATPPVLAGLAARMTPSQRTRIRGVHYGGLALAPELLMRLQAEAFTNAIHLSGYGNTLFGCCLELDCSRGRELRYFPAGNRLLLGTCGDPNDAHSIDYITPNAQGRCVFTRLDRTALIVNMLERDTLSLVPPPPSAPSEFIANGVAAPLPIADPNRAPAAAIY